MNEQMNEQTNIRTDEWKDENYIPLGINAGGITTEQGGDIVFPIISQWGFSVDMETRISIQSAPKPFLHPSDATHKI